MGVDGSHSPAGHNWGSRRACPPEQSVTSCTPALAGSARSHTQGNQLLRKHISHISNFRHIPEQENIVENGLPINNILVHSIID